MTRRPRSAAVRGRTISVYYVDCWGETLAVQVSRFDGAEAVCRIVEVFYTNGRYTRGSRDGHEIRVRADALGKLREKRVS